MASRNLNIIVWGKKNKLLACTAGTVSRCNTHQDIETRALVFDLMQTPPGWFLPAALKIGAQRCSRETGSLGRLGMCYNRYWVCYCTSRRERGSVFRCGCVGAGGDVYLSFLVTQAVISHSIFKAWKNRPQPSVSDRNPIKHHLQMIVSLQQDNQVKDVKTLICQRRSYDYSYMLYQTFMEFCENMLELEAAANLRLASEDVWLFSLRKLKPFREKLRCRTLKFPWPLTSHRGSQNKDTQEFVKKKKRDKNDELQCLKKKEVMGETGEEMQRRGRGSSTQEGWVWPSGGVKDNKERLKSCWWITAGQMRDPF